MSSISENTALMAILSELKTLNGRISSLESSKPSAPAAGGKAKKEKKERKSKSSDSEPRAPTAWRLFADRVRTLLRAEGYEGKALGPQCVQFASSLKEENADFSSWSDSDILARRAAWSAPEVSKGELKGGKGWAKTGERRASSKPSSVVSGEAPEEAEEEAEKPKKARKNPWEGLSDEQKAERIAKMKAGKAAKKAAAESSAPEAEEEAPVSPKVKAEAAPKASAPKEAKPSSPKAAPKSTPVVPVAAAPAAAGQFKPVLLVGVRYLVNMESGHAYYRNEDGSQGDWAGIFSRTPKPHVDTSVPEPGAEGEEEELNFDDE
jgi:hypothetical protein